MPYGSETRPLLVDVGLKFERADMQMVRWMCSVSMKDRRTNEELSLSQLLLEVVVWGWYGHVMKKYDEMYGV